jgi:hypothetical protein
MSGFILPPAHPEERLSLSKARLEGRMVPLPIKGRGFHRDIGADRYMFKSSIIG